MGMWATLFYEVRAGSVRLTDRDVAGLVWCGEMYGVRADLLGEVLAASADVVRQLHVRWRRAGLAETGRLGPGGVWCWLTQAGLDACGLQYANYRPSLGRLAHVHAVGCVRRALEDWDPWWSGRAKWRSERRLRYRAGSAAGRRGHVPDGEVLWPEGGLRWAGVVRRGRGDGKDGAADRGHHGRAAGPLARL
jgi:hypothetical protein